jgi:glycosyltransferase involved in cell wall biosynthesis
MPRTSVIVPAYNSARYLKAALTSVLIQTVSDWEIILVDDGSTDNTRETVAALQPAFGNKLKYVYQSNRGLPGARNAGIRQSSGELLALLDADDVWLPNRLERGLASLDSDSRCGLVHAKIAMIDARGEFTGCPPAPSPKYLSGHIARYLYDRRAHVLCPTVLVRRRCLDDVGLFDEGLRATEDRDLWYRIARRYQVAYIPEVLACYRVSPGSMSSDCARMLAAQMRFVEKHRLPGITGLVAARVAIGNSYRERGDQTLNHGSLKEAIGWYLRSIGAYPLNMRNLYMLLRAFAEPIIGTPGRQSKPGVLNRRRELPSESVLR